MKKYIIILLAMISIVGAKAQEEAIIFTDFEPDLVAATQGVNEDTLKIDIDNDGQFDIKFYITNNMLYHVDDAYYHALNNWKICSCYREGDSTILNADYLVWMSHYTDGYYTEYFGMKKEVGDDVYYGWFYSYVINNWSNGNKDPWWIVYIDRMAYCTIPNYPLRAGQTSLTEGVEENEAVVFATLHPNPTTSQVTITGQNLKTAEVFNTLGQHVATAMGDGERLTVDLCGQPAGVYFVNITDKEGRKSVRKVVKE